MKKITLLNTFKTLAVICLITFISLSCKKSFQNGLVFSVAPSSFKYTAFVQITDATNSNRAPGNISVNITGQDAQYIYDLTSGKNSLTVNPDGTIQVLIKPGRLPGAPVKFTMNVASPGYLPIAKKVVITSADTSQVLRIGLQNPNTSVPSGYKPFVASFSLVNGALPSNSIIKIGANGVSVIQNNKSKAKIGTFGGSDTTLLNSNYSDDGLTSVVLPKGTTFHYWTQLQTGIQTDSITVQQDSLQPGPGVTGVASGNTGKLITYYTREAVTYPIISNIDNKLATSDSISVVLDYTSGYNITTDVEEEYSGEVIPTVNTLYSNSVPKDQLLYTSLVQKKLADNPRFFSTFTINKMTYWDKKLAKNVDTIGSFRVYNQEVFPDQTSNWFTSFVLYDTIKNPATGVPFKDGDSIEIGIDPTTNVTVRQVVHSINGQLRAQMLSFDAGYFYQAPYVQPVNLTLVPNNGNVSDGYNVVNYTSIAGGYFYWVSDAYNSQPYSVIATIASTTPIPTTTITNTYYWGNLVGTNTSSLQGIIQIPYFTPPYNTIEFDLYAKAERNLTKIVVSSTPAQDSVLYERPNVWVTIGNANTGSSSYLSGSGFAHVNNGYFYTNACPPNANLNIFGWLENYQGSINFTTTYPITTQYWDFPYTH